MGHKHLGVFDYEIFSHLIIIYEPVSVINDVSV